MAEEADVDHLPDWKRHITLVLDEMKIKECLVYDKHETEVIGFAEINNHLARFERQCNGQECPVSLATHMLVLMVQGIFTGLRFPYVYFPTANITCEQLFNLLWEGIERLEHKGFKVLVVSADGAASNRKLFRMHGENTGTSPYNPTYKPTLTTNDHFFMSDVLHLLKTTRNKCLAIDIQGSCGYALVLG